MNLANGVKAVSLDVNGLEWEIRSKTIKSLDGAMMSKVGCGYRVSIPFYGSTKNQMFRDRDSAFSFINKFIVSEG
jgi:hypothetical protein